MGRFTVYRADVASPRLARLLGKVPGVAVAGDEPDAETELSATEDDGGLREKVPTPDVGLSENTPDIDLLDAETGAVVKRYGLLGLGVSMVMLGFATVGIWLYLRRRGDGGESETPPPTTGLEPATETPSPSTATEPAGADETDETVLSTGEAAADESEPYGRTEDREDVEWTTKDRTPADESEPAAAVDAPTEPSDESDPTDEKSRPDESVDAAPLLGVAFVAVTGVVVRWLQGDEDET